MSDKAIFDGAVRVAGFVLLAKVLIALREVALAAVYGVGPVTDSYNVAFSTGTWFPVMISAAAGAALVPALVRTNRSIVAGERERFIEELNGHAVAVALVALGIGLVLAIAGPMVFDFPDPSIGLRAQELMFAFAPFAAMTVLFYYLSAQLQAMGSFAYAAVEAVPAVFVAGAVLILGRTDSVLALGFGSTLGGIAQVGLLVALLSKIGPHPWRLRLSRTAPEWRVLLAGIGFMAFGQAALSLVTPLDQYFALKVGAGTPAAFGYANRLIGLATSVGTLVLARALLPSLAAYRHGDPALAKRVARKWAIYAFGLGAAALAVGYFLAEPATRIAFQRGSFGAADSARVAMLLTLSLLQLPFYFSGVAAVQWLAVEGRFKAIALICLATLALKLALLAVLVPSLGAVGLMLSTAGMYAGAWIVQFGLVLTAQKKQPPEGLIV